MKITTQRDLLLTTLGVVSRAVAPSSTLPILGNVLLDAANGQLTLHAYGDDLDIRAHLPVDVEEAGRTTMPAKPLTEYVSAQPAGSPLTITVTDQDQATFTSGRSQMELIGLPAVEFRAFPELVDEPRMTFTQRQLRQMITGCVMAVSKAESRQYLTGLLFAPDEGRLRVVGTDSHRLATVTAALEEMPEFAQDLIIPARTLREVARLLADDDEQSVTIDFNANLVRFTIDEVTVVSRVIEGEYPKYRRVMPKRIERVLTYNTGELREAVRRSEIVSRDETSHKVTWSIDEEGKTTLHTRNTRGGSSAQVVVAEDVELHDVPEEKLVFGFNTSYLLDVLGFINTDSCQLCLGEINGPAIVRPVDDTDYMYVLMPMTVV